MILKERENNIRIIEPIRLGKSAFFTYSDFSLYIVFDDNMLINVNDANNNYQLIASVSFKKLIEEWIKYADNPFYYNYVDNKKVYFVPQEVWQDGWWRRGFVVTENEPLNYATNLPQDFVELYRYKNDWFEYKPVVYSVAVSLKFVLSSDKNRWNVNKMTPEEIENEVINSRR